VETRKDSIHGYINKLKKQTSTFLNNNGNILLTRADKGNITVVLDKNNYIKDIERMLQDNNSYIKIKKDPTKSLIGSLRKLLTR